VTETETPKSCDSWLASRLFKALPALLSCLLSAATAVAALVPAGKMMRACTLTDEVLVCSRLRPNTVSLRPVVAAPTVTVMPDVGMVTGNPELLATALAKAWEKLDTKEAYVWLVVLVSWVAYDVGRVMVIVCEKGRGQR
jgi:hypothetical protein